MRQLLRHCFAHPRHVLVAADAVLLLERHLHGGRVRAGVARVEGREARLHADVRDDQVEILRRDDAAHERLDPVDLRGGDFEAAAGRRLDVHHELACVRARKERHAEQRIQQQAGREDGRQSIR